MHSINLYSVNAMREKKVKNKKLYRCNAFVFNRIPVYEKHENKHQTLGFHVLLPLNYLIIE